ncbi:sigma-54-dependent Fis family transcriptional regulator, partial [bacterium]|nr:sigma-54-dependent Fis family transcriptional regulator [bacterium]
ITGESGTGKELVARAIHYRGTNASAPFIPVNCGAIPETLLESELFGHVKGAFTGANMSRPGFLQAANGGTIFLDEISDTSFAMQTKLLRVLQEKEVFMVGSRKPKKINVRIIVATNKNLMRLVEKGVFREDLYYRLNVISINVPPLRERSQDARLLANYFIDRFTKEENMEKKEFSSKTLKIFDDYYWPGNVRELENLVLRLVVMIDSKLIKPPDLPGHMRLSYKKERNLSRSLLEVEMEYINNVLNVNSGNKTKTASILGINRKTLREKLYRFSKNNPGENNPTTDQ